MYNFYIMVLVGFYFTYIAGMLELIRITLVF